MTGDAFRPGSGAAPGRDPLRCTAPGCPNRWTAWEDGRGYLCRPHAVVPSRLWALVTDEQLRSRADPMPPPRDPLDEAAALEARERLKRLRAQLVADPPSRLPRRWAQAMQHRRHQTPAQRRAWREALGYPTDDNVAP